MLLFIAIARRSRFAQLMNTDIIFSLCVIVNILGPGPGRYKLPACVGHSGHDPTRKTMPAFSFGKRLENSSESAILTI